MKTLFLCALAISLALPATAQTRRSVRDHQLWAELQSELALKNGDYLLLALHGENVPAYNGSYMSVPPGATYRYRVLGFDTRSIGAAYEHFWSDRWSGGVALVHQSLSGYKYVVPEVLLRHRSPVGPLTFGQRLGVSRTFGVGDRGRVVGAEGNNYASLRVDLEKLLPVGGGPLRLRPRLSYEAVAHVRLQTTTADSKERTIQYTSLRGEVGVRLSDHVDFTPWFAYTTAYYFTLGQYSAISGTPTAPDGRLNLVTPVVGLDARFTLFAGKAVFERRQLPTQH